MMNIKRKNIYRIILFLALSSFVTLLQAQNISGKVIDENSLKPLSYANVISLRIVDSTFVAGTTTDNEGMFSINSLNENCFFRISLLGYKTIEINQTDLDIIKLVPDSQSLSEVTVTASAPVFKMENRGISTDIQNSRFREIGTASDVLAHLPFVTKEGENFSVFGKGTPLIYINNRLIRDLAELEELNSENIKKVTVITNPGVEYDATVNSVIKIETIKLKGEGLSGNGTGNIIIDRKFSHNELINLNYRRKNLDIFGMFRFSQGRDLQNIDIIQSNEIVYLTEFLKRGIYSKNFRANGGLNYSFGNKQSVGFKYEFKGSPTSIEKQLMNISTSINGIPENKIYSVQDNKGKQTSHYVNAYYNGKLLPYMDVNLNMDFANGKTTNNQNTNNYLQDSIENIFTNGLQKYDLFATKLTIETPVLKGMLTYGFEYAYTNNEQIFNVNDAGIAINLVPDNNIAKQNLLAPFLKFNKSIKYFSVELGIRYENIWFNYFINNNKNEEQSFIFHNLFPNIDLIYSREPIKMMLSYRKTIRRPSYYELRNNIQYNNLYVYETGNPYLQPVITNSLSHLFHWKSFQLIADYIMQKNFIYLYPHHYSGNIILYKPENIEKRRNISISGSFSPTVDKWNPSIELGFSKDYLKYGDPVLTYNQPVFNMDVENSFLLFKNLRLGVDMYYTTSGNRGFYYYEDRFGTDIYLSKTFFRDKLRVNLKGNDIFNTDRIKRHVFVNNIFSSTMNDLNSRNITLSVTYRFNATTSKYRGEEASKELNRLQ